MILQSLSNYYEELMKNEKVGQEGWNSAKVSYAITIDENGIVKNIVSLMSAQVNGKKKSPVNRMVPLQKGRSRKPVPYFMCDNARYLLGVYAVSDNDKETEKNRKQAEEYFLVSRKLHKSILASSDNIFALSVCRFFDTWSFEENKDRIEVDWDELLSASGIIFRSFETRKELLLDDEIQRLWNQHNGENSDGETGRCLVTGKYAPIARLHPLIKGVRDAQSSGAALVSFNAPAFESYGKEQGANAPVSEYVANAYGQALNYLLSDKKHHILLGDATVVFWAEKDQDEYVDCFAEMMGEEEISEGEKLLQIMSALSKGQACIYKDKELKPDTKFYILGLSPNAARLSVRFFHNSSFGDMVYNMNEHINRLLMIGKGKGAYPSVRAILFETVNKNSKTKQSQPILSGTLMSAVLNNQRYPAAIYSHILMRIRAERTVNRNRAAMLKAFIIKNYSEKKEVVDNMELNENTDYAPYVLGRIFAVLENIQYTAIKKETIKERFFNSACSTPAVAFPQLLRLESSHMNVIARQNKGAYIALEKKLRELIDKLQEGFPKYLSLEDQGIFIIGYYHQVQKDFKELEVRKEKVEEVS